MKDSRLLFLILIVISLLSMVLAMAVGSVTVSAAELWAIWSGNSDDIKATIVMELRWPRAVAGFVTGGLLALAGALMQVLLRNPLADPYVLGISGGAAVAVLAGMLLGISGVWLSGSALLGAFVSMLLVFGIAHGHGGWTSTRLLLTGVVIAAGWSAVISFILSISPDQTLRGMLFWMMGDLSYSELPVAGCIVLLLGLLLALALARPLNLFVRGELQAAALGVAVMPLRIGLYFLASLLTATAVMIAGGVGFVGLIVPHMLRLLGARDHRVLLPATVLCGGSLLVLADTLARTLLAPQQLPVGVLTAMLGVPLFLFLLYRGRSRIPL